MLALYRSGRQAEALAAYRDARRTLLDELGIEPTRALQDLEKAILAQDPALEGATPQAALLLRLLPGGTPRLPSSAATRSSSSSRPRSTTPWPAEDACSSSSAPRVPARPTSPTRSPAGRRPWRRVRWGRGWDGG
jgi:hypothetical protein